MSKESGIPPRIIAMDIIDRILEEKKNKDNIQSKIHKIGSTLFGYSIIPDFLIKRYAFERFKRNIRKDMTTYR